MTVEDQEKLETMEKLLETVRRYEEGGARQQTTKRHRAAGADNFSKKASTSENEAERGRVRPGSPSGRSGHRMRHDGFHTVTVFASHGQNGKFLHPLPACRAPTGATPAPHAHFGGHARETTGRERPQPWEEPPCGRKNGRSLKPRPRREVEEVDHRLGRRQRYPSHDTRKGAHRGPNCATHNGGTYMWTARARDARDCSAQTERGTWRLQRGQRGCLRTKRNWDKPKQTE